MRYLLNNSTDPYFNMALDEFCLENIVLDEPYFYLWRNRPSVIIGLNQNAYSEVNLKYLEENGIDLVRMTLPLPVLRTLSGQMVAAVYCHRPRQDRRL